MLFPWKNALFYPIFSSSMAASNSHRDPLFYRIFSIAVSVEFVVVTTCTILLHIVSASAVFLFACSFDVGEEARNMWVCPKEA